MKPISDIRKEYERQTLDEALVPANPFEQFKSWWQLAIEQNLDEVNAMTLCTVTETGMPDGRIVLLKGFDENGFVFFSNYNSAKGKQLNASPFATLVFFWKELERQVRIAGSVKKLGEKENDDYFFSRPRGSQLGALVSNQSEVIENRGVLEKKLLQLEAQFENTKPLRPTNWGGYCVMPIQIEFWQGRPNRLHDRICYTLSAEGWKIERLSP